MNLVTRFLAARRDKLLMKLGCWLVCFSLVLGLMLPQQRAEALVAELTIGSVAALAASYLCACGLPLVTQGMDRDALVSNVQRLIQEFLDTELGGITIQDWLGNVWDLAVIAGKLLLGRPLTDEFVSFAQWVAGKYAVQAGENIVYEGKNGFFSFSDNDSDFSLLFNYPYSVKIQKRYYISDGNVVYQRFCNVPAGSYVLRYSSVIRPAPSDAFFLYEVSFPTTIKPVKIEQDGDFYISYYTLTESLSVPFYFRWLGESKYLDVGSVYPIDTSTSYFKYADVVDEVLSIDRAESMSYIPEGIVAEQGIALDVGAEATMDLDQVLGGVLDDVIAGELTSTMTAADEATENPPVEEEITDVDNLGLPALGAALTSRFPFSIPWDFFRAVQLLAAPAKAPYFEVDFMEPLADDVGGWNGSTTVILDFSEYAIIGQISRWTSTIGFCLMLAGATKRLIWTA